MHKLFGTIALAGLLIAPVSTWAQNDDAAAQVFAQLDANRDGKLSQAEFTAHPDLTEEVFKSWDADGDKSISKAEFTANFGQ